MNKKPILNLTYAQEEDPRVRHVFTLFEETVKDLKQTARNPEIPEEGRAKLAAAAMQGFDSLVNTTLAKLGEEVAQGVEEVKRQWIGNIDDAPLQDAATVANELAAMPPHEAERLLVEQPELRQALGRYLRAFPHGSKSEVLKERMENAFAVGGRELMQRTRERMQMVENLRLSWRIKTEEEFKRLYGQDWRDALREEEPPRNDAEAFVRQIMDFRGGAA